MTRLPTRVRLAHPVPVEDAQEVARAAEDAGFAALFVTEWHPSNPEGLPDARWTPDSLLFITAASTATRRLQFGTAVCVPSTRTARHLARTANSVSNLFNDRLILGVAASPTGGEPNPKPTEDDFLSFMAEVWAELSAFADSTPPPRIAVSSNFTTQARRHLLAYGDIWMVDASVLVSEAHSADTLHAPIIALDIEPDDRQQSDALRCAGVEMGLIKVCERTASGLISQMRSVALALKDSGKL